MGDLQIFSTDLLDTLRTVIKNNITIGSRIMHGLHDAPSGGHLGSEKTCVDATRGFY